MTDFFDRPQNEKRSPRPKQAGLNQEQCPILQNSPTHTRKSSVSTSPPAKPHRNEIWGMLLDKRRVPHGFSSDSPIDSGLKLSTQKGCYGYSNILDIPLDL